MWQVVGTPIPAERFDPFRPLHVLNSYDGPRIFTLRDAEGAMCLACWSDDDETLSRFLVVPITQVAVAELLAGVLSVRDALTHAPLWVVDLSHEGPVIAAWLANPDSVPEDAQPQLGVTLQRPLSLPQSVPIGGSVTDPAHQSASKRL